MNKHSSSRVDALGLRSTATATAISTSAGRRESSNGPGAAPITDGTLSRTPWLVC
jgi:hypothetical protein